MKNKIISIKKFILKYGLILGAIWVIYFFIKYLVTNSIYHKKDDLFSIILEIAIHTILVYPIYRYKLNNNGFLSLKQALKIGMSIALITYLICRIHFIVVNKIIEPKEMVQTLNNAREKMLIINPDTSPENARKTINSTSYFDSFYIGQLIGLTLDLMFGFVISLIAGAIMRKKKEL